MASSSNAGLTIPPDNVRPNSRCYSTPQTPTTPFSHAQPMAQRESYSAMYDRAIQAKLLAGEAYDDFYSDLDVLNRSPTGMPSIAANQMYFPNYNEHRIFKPETHATLTCFEQKIHCVANALDEMNFEDAKVEGGQSLRSLPFDREDFIARCLQGPAYLSTPTPKFGSGRTSESSTDSTPESSAGTAHESCTGELDRIAKRENLHTCLAILLKEYFTLLHMHHQNLKFPRVSRRAHEAHFRTARDREGLNNEACAYMRYIDDWIYPEPDPIFRRFENILYTRSKRLTQFLKHVCCLFCFDPLPTSASDDDPRVRYSLRGFDRFFKGLLGLISMALLAAPVSILYLRTDLSRAAYLGVVVAFSGVFCCVMTAIETNTARLIVSLAAFFAVLVTFLSNNMANCGVE
ncbi:hypothetical protein F4821DRAFT_9973 [Hypoxylon rubiginosum]|uniref:Uncharacterized protein n=1 Tax=Hypoxylon rubiginosum TaxID=110542 RepID=A0ACC0DE27_9PEZI|nr:hypothetical protein F4821DRAFT_9973 [Hypoxylon rubiginosum]